VNHEDAIKRLRALRDETATLPPSTSSAEFNSWEPRTRSALTRALGEKHYITQRFKTKWTPSAYGLGDTIAFTSPDFSCGLAVSGGGGAGRLVGLLVAGGYGKSPGVAPVGGLS
jgi:hypothetical protein